jgi:hypothetical protein
MHPVTNTQFVKLGDITAQYIDILSRDEAIEKYCFDLYGKPLKIFDGVDRLNLPQDEDAPMVILYKISHGLGQSRSIWNYELALEFSVNSEEVKEREDGSEAIEMTGVSQVENLAYLCYDALRDNVDSIVNLDSGELVLDEGDNYPLFSALLTLTTSIPQAIGVQHVIGAKR